MLARDFDGERGRRTDSHQDRRSWIPAQARSDLDGVDREVLGGARARLVGPADEALPDEEAERQLLIVSRRPHRHRERLAGDPDLQRLLDGDAVGDAVVDDGDMEMAVREVVHGCHLATRCLPGATSARTPGVGPGIWVWRVHD